MLYVTAKISDHMSLTPEGYLVCHDVPITRLGTLLYKDGEVPIDSDGSGVLKVERFAEQVFAPATIQSFEGKPVTLGHPTEMVTPETWKEQAVGQIQDVRRGTGEMHSFLIADLLITVKEAIELIKSGLREVSCGYDAEYVQIRPGVGAQSNIIGNHLALVVKGRAGKQCAIMDHDALDNGKKEKRMGLKEKIGAFFKTLDGMPEDELEKLVKGTTDAATVDSRMAALEGKFDKLVSTLDAYMKTKDDGDLDGDDKGKGKNDDDADDSKKTDDSDDNDKDDKKMTADQASVLFRETVSRAEIIQPGLKTPSFDAATVGAQIKDIRVAALSSLNSNPEGRAVIEKFTRASVNDFASLPEATLDAMFVGVSELRAQKNALGFAGRAGVTTKDFGRVATAADINRANHEYWSGRNAY